MLSTNAPRTADPNSSEVAAAKWLSPNNSNDQVPTVSMTPVWTRPATMTNRPMKNTSVGHSTSRSTSPTSRSDTSSITPAPTSAMIDGVRWKNSCSVNARATTASTISERVSSFGSRIARRSCSAITDGDVLGWYRGSARGTAPG